MNTGEPQEDSRLIFFAGVKLMVPYIFYIDARVKNLAVLRPAV